ncbi:major facilitator superfamily domain-containing protein [Cokeromyces recurvatus]|uniref:major facilitator superfamily domain-containing protein n=1 Tax=Cokeromyces recurvatus TaxID=90255 RepID=UPI002220493B|nr:major facilitator superfamily domain-containing protein [Cokeromyces recurvatus]KAI7904169.1 major facilitator superfamily domain-containing protein [Cokeromyces recurvatus]
MIKKTVTNTSSISSVMSDKEEEEQIRVETESIVVDEKIRDVKQLVKSNIGNAKLGGLEKDLNMSSTEYQWALSIFYFSYVLFDLPSNIIMRRWRASFWLAILMFCWGIVATAMAACKSFTSLMMCRFLLGLFEAGFFPGVVYFMSLWYTRQEYGRRIGFFWSFGSLAGALGGLIAFAISQIQTSALSTWQWLFIIEGAPTIILSLFSAWYLPNTPETVTTRFLTSKERDLIINRLAQDAGDSYSHAWSWKQALSVFTDWKTYFYMFIYISGTIPLQGVTLFLPSIVANMGSWSKPVAQALTIPPYSLAFIMTFIVGWSSDRYFERAFHMIALNSLAILGFLLLILLPSNVVACYFAACLVTTSVYANVAVKVAWFNNNYGGLTRRAVASATIVSFGTIGGAIGGQIYYDPPSYVKGNTIALSFVALQTCLVILLRLLLQHDNKRKQNITTQQQQQLEIERYGGPDLVGDRHYNFKYIL